MENCLGIILNESIDKDFGPLCGHRPSYMLPYAGRYRLLDFALSNMVNYQINNVVLYTGEKMRSAMDHIGSGRPWELNRRFSGLKLFSPDYNQNKAERNSQINQLFNTLKFYEDAKEDYVFLMKTDIIAKVNLDKAFKAFIDSGADISLIYKKQKDPEGLHLDYGKLHFDKEGKFKDIGTNLGIDKTYNHFLGMGFVKKDVLIKLIKTFKERENIFSVNEAISSMKNEFDIQTYEFKGKVQAIKDVESYFASSMSLLDEENYQDMFFNNGLILTKSKDEPSTSYKESSHVSNSLIANGCIIEGTVENSIIFRDVKIEKGAVVKNSIIMQKSEIGENALVANSIFDKSSKIEKNLSVSGSPETPFILEKNGIIREG